MTPATQSSENLRTLAEAFDDILELVNDEPADTVLDAVNQVAVAHVPGADWASITLLTGDHFRTAAATDDRARHVDQLQYEFLSGPCVDVARQRTVAYIRDTTRDTQWPAFASRAAAECGIGSVLSYHLTFEVIDGTIGSLNLYAGRPAAFDDEHHVACGALVATAGALAVTAARNRESAASLARGLESNREIGMAIGILMYSHKLTRDQAFDLLRIASQRRNRKLRDVAIKVVETGELELSNCGRSSRRTATGKLAGLTASEARS